MMNLLPLAIPGALPETDCARLRMLASARGWREGGLVGGRLDQDLRRAGLVWVDDLPGTGWVGDQIAAVVAEANRTRFGFDLADFAESAQIARYEAEQEGHFHWHSDVGQGPVAARRKLTVVIQLSDPADYEGGELQTWAGAEPAAHRRGLGDAVVFPSFLLHRVTRVTRGARVSLTQWVHGPAFR